MVMDSDILFLPQEIVINILKRLPVKSLIRFQCVCKEWKNLIKTPSFIADHLQHSSNQNPSLLWQRSDSTNGRRLQMLDYKLRVPEFLPSPLILSKARIVGSSNGLLCAKIYNEAPCLPSLLLWNPATRQVRVVPQPINNINGDFEVGFGFSPNVNDYKIMISHATQFFDDEDGRAEVYSLSTGSWKEIKVVNFGGVEFNYHPPVTASGAIFWFGDKPGEGEEDYDWMIISFDIAMEVFSLIPLPALLDSDSRDKLTVYENKLAILSLAVIGNDESSMIDLWVMEDGTGASGERWSWSKIYTISTFSDMVPCCIWLDEIVCRDDNLAGCETALCLLNLNTLELENFAICRCGCTHSIISNYVESLVPVANVHIEEP